MTRELFMDNSDLIINSVTDSFSTRFGVKKITYNVRLVGPDIVGALDYLIQKVINNSAEYFKVGLSITCNKCSNIFIEFRPKNTLTGQFLLQRFSKLSQSGFELFTCDTDYIFTFTLLKPRDKKRR